MANDIILSDRAIDLGLICLDTEPDRLYFCSALPTTYAQATSLAVCVHNTVAGGVFSSPVAGSPKGRKITLNAASGDTVSPGGIAGFWAAVDSVNQRLLASGPMAAPITLAAGAPFSIPSVDLTLPV